jgi:hypothetical protein
MRAIGRIRSRFSEPQNTAVFGFFRLNEPAVASGSLQCLKFFHKVSNLCSLPREGGPPSMLMNKNG